jgi:hypothetical protein
MTAAASSAQFQQTSGPSAHDSEFERMQREGLGRGHDKDHGKDHGKGHDKGHNGHGQGHCDDGDRCHASPG